MAMKITPIRTRKINPPQDEIWDVLDKIVPKLKDGVVVAITSKIVSIHEGKTLPIKEYPNEGELIKRGADYWLARRVVGKPDRFYTVAQNMLVGSSGIDQSNSKDHWVLYPRYPFESARTFRRYLMRATGIKDLGVLIVDSHSSPLRRGTTGASIAYWGFKPLRRYVGQEDIYGRRFKFSEMNVADGLAAAAAFTMGEGKEQTPIAIIGGVDKVIEFTGADPRKSGHFLSFENDTYGSLFKITSWHKNKHR
jgi:F420-0:gamma-glutamyl ligase